MPHPDYLYEIENTEPRLVELEVDAGQGSGPTTAIALCDVRFSRARLEFSSYTVYAAITHAEIKVLSIPQGRIRNRFGDDLAERDSELSSINSAAKTANKSRWADVKLGGSTSGANIRGSVGLKGSQSTSDESQKSLTVATKIPLVRARGDGMWGLATFDSTIPLEGRFIGFNELCSIESDRDIVEIEISIVVPKSNIVVEKVTDNHSGQSVNLDKGRSTLLRALIARKLAGSGDAITMCIGRMKRK